MKRKGAESSRQGRREGGDGGARRWGVEQGAGGREGGKEQGGDGGAGRWREEQGAAGGPQFPAQC